jgi:NADP-dependent 3-hydroxy acid dehydrogenase YdfG
MKKWLITGASSGFGHLLAERVARDGDHVIAVARREDRLRELAAEHDSVTPLAVDLTAPDVEQLREARTSWVMRALTAAGSFASRAANTPRTRSSGLTTCATGAAS